MVGSYSPFIYYIYMKFNSLVIMYVHKIKVPQIKNKRWSIKLIINYSQKQIKQAFFGLESGHDQNAWKLKY